MCSEALRTAWPVLAVLTLLIASVLDCGLARGGPYGLGRPVTAQEIAAWDIDVRPDGQGLPAGRGSVEQGRALFAQACASCHGAAGQGGKAPALVGGIGTLASPHPVKTVGSYWPFATTLFDYVRRAMPYDQPQSLTADQVYALVAYILHANGIVAAGTTLDAVTLPAVKMPNRDGFIVPASLSRGQKLETPHHTDVSRPSARHPGALSASPR